MCNKNIAWKKHRFNRKTDLNFIILHYMEEMNVDRIETPILAFFCPRGIKKCGIIRHGNKE